MRLIYLLLTAQFRGYHLLSLLICIYLAVTVLGRLEEAHPITPLVLSLIHHLGGL